MIYARMSGAYSLSTTYIKETGVTGKELAEVGEHLGELPGVKVGTSWTRDYPYGSSLKSILGTVSSEKKLGCQIIRSISTWHRVIPATIRLVKVTLNSSTNQFCEAVSHKLTWKFQVLRS